MKFTTELLPFQIFSLAGITLASYLSLIYYKRKHYCQLCKVTQRIKRDYNRMKPIGILRRSKRLEEKRTKK